MLVGNAEPDIVNELSDQSFFAINSMSMICGIHNVMEQYAGKGITLRASCYDPILGYVSITVAVPGFYDPGGHVHMNTQGQCG